jgi:hypothetical protein|tara:strand:+ start:295 stop:462 length:168 start_codon:yes stop_codon:yes gene_type:complete
MSKGSKQRPIKDKKQYDKNWERIFNNKDGDTNNSADAEFGFVYDEPKKKEKNERR